MIFSPIAFKDYLTHLVQEIEIIKSQFLLIDPSEVAKFVQEEISDEEIVIFGVLPDINSSSINADQVEFINTLGIRVLEKTAYKDVVHQEEYLASFQRTARAVESIIETMVYDATERNFCGILRDIDFSSIHIEPVWHVAHLNGWDIQFNVHINV